MRCETLMQAIQNVENRWAVWYNVADAMIRDMRHTLAA